MGSGEERWVIGMLNFNYFNFFNSVVSIPILICYL